MSRKSSVGCSIERGAVAAAGVTCVISNRARRREHVSAALSCAMPNARQPRFKVLTTLRCYLVLNIFAPFALISSGANRCRGVYELCLSSSHFASSSARVLIQQANETRAVTHFSSMRLLRNDSSGGAAERPGFAEHLPKIGIGAHLRSSCHRFYGVGIYSCHTINFQPVFLHVKARVPSCLHCLG